MSIKKCWKTLQEEKTWSKIRNRKGVLNAYAGNKIKDGKNTEKPAIVILVEKKKTVDELLRVDVIPKTINGCTTDVIELSTEDYVLGDTEPSRRTPEIQRRISGGVKQ